MLLPIPLKANKIFTHSDNRYTPKQTDGSIISVSTSKKKNGRRNVVEQSSTNLLIPFFEAFRVQRVQRSSEEKEEEKEEEEEGDEGNR